MTIELAPLGRNRLSTTALLVFAETPLTGRHPLLAALEPLDRNHALLALADFDPRGGNVLRATLPSGRNLLCVPGGEKKKYSARKAVLALRRTIIVARTYRATELSLFLADYLPQGGNMASFIETAATQCQLAHFEFISYKKEPEGGWPQIDTITLLLPGNSTAREREALRIGTIIGEETNHARTLSNTPGGDMTPPVLAVAAQKIAERIPRITTTVLGEKELTALGAGGILGVARGSAAPPRLIIMEYRGGRKKDAPIVLVGKGVTFDTGGLNLKPSAGINDMHHDMAGGAAAMHALAALARIRVPKNVTVLVPAVENMPSGSSYRPGDLLRSLSGAYIEVLNTDAEGRIILADALTYAERYEPKLVVDVATLTGASMVALGQRASVLCTPDYRLSKIVIEAGERAAEYVWPLPLWEEYEEEVKGTFGDVANIGKYDRLGGAITGAIFLWQFAKKYPWAHIDIAPRMVSIEGDHLAKGATGVGVGLLTNIVRAR